MADKVPAYGVLFGRLGSSRHCRPAVDSLLSLLATCRSSGMTGTINEEHDVLRITNWVHDARLGSIQHQQLLACIEAPTDGMILALSQLIAAGLQHLCVVNASSLLKQHAAALHHLGLLCVALAASVQFWCAWMAPNAADNGMAIRIKMSTQLASSGERLKYLSQGGSISLQLLKSCAHRATA